MNKTILPLLAIATLSQLVGISGISEIRQASAQSIIPANDLGTNVTQQGNRFDIGGGTQAGANLFHSFQQFGLDRGQIANFLSNPSIQNILSRVVGGDPSVINGLIQLTGGNSNLYIMNPAGIIFGANASLNVPAAFTATTANGIQVGNGWFGINTSVDAIKTLTGTPNSFGFANPVPVGGTVSNTTGGAIVNAGNLSVKEGQSITLVGGTVINTGTIAAPTGKITIAAVENGKYVRISQTGSLLSLDLPVADKEELTANSKPIQATDLPTLLTGRPDLAAVTGLSVNTLGQVVLPNSVAVPTQTGTAIASGNLDVSSSASLGGTIHILGTNVGLVGAKIDASGLTGGGTVLIGGDHQGKGTVPNAQFTYVSLDSTIIADALHSGNGGKVVVWADDKTSFSGNISVRGGTDGGNGGFVETSGKNYLNVRNASVDASASKGKLGNWLLDPRNIIVQTVGANATLIDVANGADTTNDFTIDPATIFNATADVTLIASNNITFNESVSNNNNDVSLKVIAGNQITSIAGAFISMSGGQNSDVLLSAIGDVSVGDSITSQRNISIRSTNGNISTKDIKAGFNGGSGSVVSLTADNGNITLDGVIQSGDVNNSSDSTVIIKGNRFQAINPRSGASLATQFAKDPADNFPLSIIAFPKNVSYPIASQDRRSVTLSLPGDASPRVISGLATDTVIVSITILKDTTFTIPTLVNYDPTKPITTANVITTPIPANGSGLLGFITLGSTNIPPNVFVLVSDQSFTANPSLTNASTGVLATTPTDGAVAAARTAEVQTASNIDTCDPDKDKKPALNVTASLPAPVSGGVDRGGTSGSSGQDGSRDAKAKLPPCK